MVKPANDSPVRMISSPEKEASLVLVLQGGPTPNKPERPNPEKGRVGGLLGSLETRHSMCPLHKAVAVNPGQLGRERIALEKRAEELGAYKGF